MNSQILFQRIRDIEYQFLRSYNTSSLTDENKVDIVLTILVGVLKNAPDSSIIINQLPTNIFNCTINWEIDGLNKKLVRVTSGSEIIEHDLSTNYKRLTISDELSQALSLIININGNVSAPEVSYTYVNDSVLKSDALSLIESIN